MFDFLRKSGGQEAKTSALNRALRDLAQGSGNLLEAAVVLHLLMSSDDSLHRLLTTFAGSDVYTLNKGPKRIADASIMAASDGNSYLVALTSAERAAAALPEDAPFERRQVSALELVYALPEGLGIVLNPDDELITWPFIPAQVTDLRKIYAKNLIYDTGGIFSIWMGDAYRCAKLLQQDEGGFHIRLYANIWPERPSTVDPSTLTLTAPSGEPPRAYGHLPLSKASFLAMGPRLAATTTVKLEELEGYEIWKEAQGGCF